MKLNTTLTSLIGRQCFFRTVMAHRFLEIALNH